jgi:hypothetical protein
MFDPMLRRPKMFSTTIASSLGAEHATELRRDARAVLRRARSAATTNQAEVTIRVAGAADRDALERLAQLDSREAPTGYVLVAEVSGELRAAVPVTGGEPVADPFHPTAALTSLLRLRARQLRAGEKAAARHTARGRLVAVMDR